MGRLEGQFEAYFVLAGSKHEKTVSGTFQLGTVVLRENAKSGVVLMTGVGSEQGWAIADRNVCRWVTTEDGTEKVGDD